VAPVMTATFLFNLPSGCGISFKADIKTNRFNTKIRCLRRVNKYFVPIGSVSDNGGNGTTQKIQPARCLREGAAGFLEAWFADASLHELEVATGVNKSGLYSEFVDKEDLFVQSLRYYL
jgi:hypothetical protein